MLDISLRQEATNPDVVASRDSPLVLVQTIAEFGFVYERGCGGDMARVTCICVDALDTTLDLAGAVLLVGGEAARGELVSEAAVRSREGAGQ